MGAHNAAHDLAYTEYTISDPGDGNAVPEYLTGCCEIVIAGTETNSLARPSKSGLFLGINCKTYTSGTRTVTVAGGYDEVGGTDIVFTAAGAFILFYSVRDTGSTFCWRVVAYDNVTGPTVTYASLVATSIDVSTVTNASLDIESLNAMTIKLNDTEALKLDNAPITGFEALSDTAGGGVFFESRSAGASETGAKAGGSIYGYAGAGGASAVAFAGGAGGGFAIYPGAGGANTGGAAGQAGGAGGAIAITSGAGGTTNSTGAHAGGASGAVAIASGIGGAQLGAAQAGGAAGAVSVTGGVGGGTITAGATGGAGGTVTITAGAGGVDAEAGSGTGGAGGDIVLTPGAGGLGATTGAPGYVNVSNGKNLFVGTKTVPGTTEGTNWIGIKDGTNPTGTVATGLILYSSDGDSLDFLHADGTTDQLGT